MTMLSDQINDKRSEISADLDWMMRSALGLEGQFQRCRDAASTLAAAIAALPESEAKTALYSAWEKFMQQDAGNFEPPYPVSS